MLGRLFSAKPDHPLADAKEAKRLLAELLTLEPADAVDSAEAWLESLVATEDFRCEHRLELILQIDEAVLPQLRRLTRDYLTTPRLTKGQEFKLWQMDRNYWASLSAAYEDTLERCRRNAKDAETIKPRWALLCARLLQAYGGRLKWDQFRYGPIDNSLWAAAGGAYLAAAQNRQTQTRLALYAGNESSVEAEYMRLLVFQASSMGNLLPVEIELAERLIAHFLPSFALVDQARPESVYWVDAAKPLPPTRLAVSPEITTTLRFFSTGQALDGLKEIKARIEASGQLPTDINFGGQYSAKVVLPVLEHLTLCWAPKPPLRSHARHRVMSRLAVVGGLKAIHQRLGSDGGADATEAWVVDDVSQGGVGARVSTVNNDWLRVGSVIAMQPEGGSNWLVGMVRRFARESGSLGSVGIETLSKAPRSATADSAGLQTEIVLLDPPQPGESARVLLDATAWEDVIPLVFVLDGQRWRLHPREVLETGADCAVGRYQVE